MTVAWTSPAAVIAALGGGSAAPAPDDPWLVQVCAAANAAAWRKRHEAGYADNPADGAVAPSPDVAMGATLWAVALWRQRASVDGFASFEDLTTFAPTGGAWGEIRRQLGIGRAVTDHERLALEVNPLTRRRRFLARYGGRRL